MLQTMAGSRLTLHYRISQNELIYMLFLVKRTAIVVAQQYQMLLKQTCRNPSMG